MSGKHPWHRDTENSVRDNQFWVQRDVTGHVQWGLGKGVQELGPSCSALWGFPELFGGEERCTPHKERGVYVSGGVIPSKKHPQREAATGNPTGSHKTTSTTTTKALGWYLSCGVISVRGELRADFSFNAVFLLSFVWNSRLRRCLWALPHGQITQGPPLCVCASPQLPVNLRFVLNK